MAVTGELNYSEITIETLKMLRKWQNIVPADHQAIAESVCYDNKSLRYCAQIYRKSRRTISKMLRDSLGVWCLLLNPRLIEKKDKKRIKKGYQQKQGFTATKTVIFVDEEK